VICELFIILLVYRANHIIQEEDHYSADQKSIGDMHDRMRQKPVMLILWFLAMRTTDRSFVDVRKTDGALFLFFHSFLERGALAMAR
jgi:hypothetical protein